MSVIIKALEAVELLDSRGRPTVGCCLRLQGGVTGLASVPSGASCGSYEAVELRDNDKTRFFGLGVKRAIGHIEKDIANELIGAEFTSQEQLDARLIALDGTVQKSHLGANALLAVSMAFARAFSKHKGCELFESLSDGVGTGCLPVPFMNAINGGAHAHNNLLLQEFMFVPHGFDYFHEALRCGVEIMHCLGRDLAKRYGDVGRGDEGGYAPVGLNSTEEALERLLAAIKEAGYSLDQVGLALDLASSEFYEDGCYQSDQDSSKVLTREEWAARLLKLQQSYPIISMEDPFSEDDWQGWSMLAQRMPERMMLVGDDVFVTQAERLKQGISVGAANAILIKPNQVGTLSEVYETVKCARDNGYSQMLSHRSGETEDSIIADCVVAWSCGRIKTGPPRQADRTSKLNRLLWIEKLTGKKLARL